MKKGAVIALCLTTGLIGLLFGFSEGHEAGHEQGHYEAWHEADTWAENVHHACMENAQEPTP